LVEAVTFRLEGHHDGDPAAYVDLELRRSWLARDPLPRYEEILGSRGLLDETRRAYLGEKVHSRVARAVEWARRPEDSSPAEALPHPVGRAPQTRPCPRRAAVALGEALARALDEEMERDPAVVVLGSDVGRLGGPHGSRGGCWRGTARIG